MEELAHCLAALAPAPRHCVLYAPLAIGNHVDHQIARRSAALLHDHGYGVGYYEDFPYIARDPAGLAASLGEPNRWQSRLIPLSQADVQRKVDAVLAYASQLAVLFAGQEAIDRRVAAALLSQAEHTGNGQPAERLWHPQDPG